MGRCTVREGRVTGFRPWKEVLHCVSKLDVTIEAGFTGIESELETKSGWGGMGRYGEIFSFLDEVR